MICGSIFEHELVMKITKGTLLPRLFLQSQTVIEMDTMKTYENSFGCMAGFHGRNVFYHLD